MYNGILGPRKKNAEPVEEGNSQRKNVEFPGLK